MKHKIILFLCLLLFLTSCDGDFYVPNSQRAFVEYDGSLKATELVTDAPWSNREDHASIVFDNAIWILGGYDSSARGNQDCYKEDVWKSTDGINWEEVTDNAPWHGRRAMAATVADGYIYISGGFYVDETSGERGFANDLWRSNDGETWEEVTNSTTTPWKAREYHAMLSYEDNLYVFGGYGNDSDTRYYLSDMYKYDISERTWSCITEDTGFGGRSAFAYFKDPLDNFYIQGGAWQGSTQASSGQVDPSITNWSSVWTFNPKDEESGWSVVKRSAPIQNAKSRSRHSIVYTDNNVWLLPGKSNSSYRFSKNDDTYLTLYYDLSKNNNTVNPWTLDSYGSPVEPRYGYRAEYFNNKIYIMGGYSNNGPQNDVWTLEFTTEEEN